MCSYMCIYNWLIKKFNQAPAIYLNGKWKNKLCVWCVTCVKEHMDKSTSLALFQYHNNPQKGANIEKIQYYDYLFQLIIQKKKIFHSFEVSNS